MFRILLALMAGLSLAACETPEKDPLETSEQQGAAEAEAGEIVAPDMAPMSVTGALSYSQRMALPTDAVVEITISPARVPEDTPEPLGTQSFALNGRQVPIPFEIELGNELAPETGPLRIEAIITDGTETVIWETAQETTFEFQAGNVDLDIIRLVPTSAAVVDKSELGGRTWMVARMGGEPVLHTSSVTMNFGEDGHLSGEASCNAYTGSYTLKHGELSIAPLALTRKACVPQLMEQEEAFISLLQTVSQVRIDAQGKLLLENAEGEAITAR